MQQRTAACSGRNATARVSNGYPPRGAMAVDSNGNVAVTGSYYLSPAHLGEKFTENGRNPAFRSRVFAAVLQIAEGVRRNGSRPSRVLARLACIPVPAASVSQRMYCSIWLKFLKCPGFAIDMEGPLVYAIPALSSKISSPSTLNLRLDVDGSCERRRKAHFIGSEATFVSPTCAGSRL